MGFIRQQEERWALKLLQWQHEKHHVPLPGQEALERQARTLVEDAHRIARERGSNLWAILRETAAELIRNRK